MYVYDQNKLYLYFIYSQIHFSEINSVVAQTMFDTQLFHFEVPTLLGRITRKKIH